MTLSIEINGSANFAYAVDSREHRTAYDPGIDKAKTSTGRAIKGINPAVVCGEDLCRLRTRGLCDGPLCSFRRFV